jgi:hypothetical protein
MRNIKRVALLGSVAMAAGLVLVAPTSAQAAEAGTGAVLMAGSATTAAWVDDGTVDDLTNGPVTLEGTTASAKVSVFQAPSPTIATLSSSAGDLPTSGTHAVSAAGPLTLTIDRPGLVCTVTGDVTIRELVFDAGVPTAFAADWSGDCGAVTGTTGQVRGASSVPWGGLDVMPDLSWNAPFVGEANVPTMLYVTARGNDIPTIVGVDVASDAPEDSFVVKHGTDQCTGAVLAHLDVCTITLVAGPRSTTPAALTEHLVLTTDAGGTSTTNLTYDSTRVSKRGQFFPTSARVMDTRTGTGVRKGVVKGGSSVSLPVAGHNGVPASGVSAAVFNVTVTGSTASSFATVYPGGTTRPNTSNLNFRTGFTGANLVTVPLGTDGAVRFYNNAGSVHFIADLVGYYSAAPTFSKSGGNDFYTTAPSRVLDSRTDWDGVKLGSQEYFPLSLNFDAEFNPRIRGFVFTLTATNATKPGVLSVTPTQPTGPATTSSVNYQPGPAVANLVAAKTTQELFEGSLYPTVWIANSAGASTHLIVDLVGVYAQEVDGDEGLRFRPLAPTRILDTKTDIGATSVGTGVAKVIQAPTSVAGRDTWALAGNITGVLPTQNTYLTIWGGGANPGTSSVNLTKGITRANAAWTGVSNTNTYSVFNVAGRTDTLYDVSGSFEGWPASPATIAGIPWNPALATARGEAALAGTARPEAPQPRDAQLVERQAPKHL